MRHNHVVNRDQPTPILGFAHRGARAHAPENTLESFVLARRMGATAIETDVWCTADGVVVVDHDGNVALGGRKVPIITLPVSALPRHIPTLADVMATIGDDVDLSIDVKDATASFETLRVTLASAGASPRRVWLCHPDLSVLQGIRNMSDEVRLVGSIKRRRVSLDPACAPDRLADMGIDVLNMRGDTWTPGLIARCHRVGLLAFAWNVQRTWHMRRLASWGIDGLYSDHTDRLVAFLASRRADTDPR